jgi:KaiC/GvpD/RAD55 family RecA-like ATPase
MAFGGVTTLFVIEEGTVNKTTLNNIKYIMDGIIEFKKENDTKQCRVSSMKWAAYQNDWVTLS